MFFRVRTEELWAFHEVAASWIMEEFGEAQKTTSFLNLIREAYLVNM